MRSDLSGLQGNSKAYGRLGPLAAAAVILSVVALRPAPGPTSTRALILRLEAAPWQELANLPGSGRPLARRIVAFRQEVAPLTPPDGVRWVSGVGMRRLHAWSRWIEPEAGAP